MRFFRLCFYGIIYCPGQTSKHTEYFWAFSLSPLSVYISSRSVLIYFSIYASFVLALYCIIYRGCSSATIRSKKWYVLLSSFRNFSFFPIPLQKQISRFWSSSSNPKAYEVPLGVWLGSWLIGWLVNWLIGWLVGWLIGWLAGWLADWLIGGVNKRFRVLRTTKGLSSVDGVQCITCFECQ